MRLRTTRAQLCGGLAGRCISTITFSVAVLLGAASNAYATDAKVDAKAKTWVKTAQGKFNVVNVERTPHQQVIAELVKSVEQSVRQRSQSLQPKSIAVKKVEPADLELADSHDDYLQRRLDGKIRQLNLGALVDKRKLSIALADVTDPIAPRLASVNGNEMMYAASLPKIAILFGAYEMAATGDMKIDKPMRKKLTSMIRSSSNTAASDVLLEIGMPKLAKMLQSERYKFYDKRNGGGLWVGKPYARSKAWKRDPLKNLSHAATALQVARFYYMMETGQLVSEQDSAAMKAIMGKPALNHKFVGGLAEAGRGDAKLYRKSGTWRDYHADSAIVEHAGRTYIAVALAKHKKGGDILKDLIVAMDDVILGNDQLSAASHAHDAAVAVR